MRLFRDPGGPTEQGLECIGGYCRIFSFLTVKFLWSLWMCYCDYSASISYWLLENGLSLIINLLYDISKTALYIYLQQWQEWTEMTINHVFVFLCVFLSLSAGLQNHFDRALNLFLILYRNCGIVTLSLHAVPMRPLISIQSRSMKTSLEWSIQTFCLISCKNSAI